MIRPHATRIGLTQRDVASSTAPSEASTSLATLRTEIRDVLSDVRRVEAKFDRPLGLGMVNEQRARFSAMEQKLGTLEEWIKRQFGAVIVRLEGVEEKVEDLGKTVGEVEEAFEREVGVCEDLRERFESMNERLDKAEEGCVVVEDTYERLEKVEEAYVVVRRLCEELGDRVERSDQNAREKESFDRVVNKRLHDLEVAQKEDRKQALHSHHEMERKIAEVGKSMQGNFRQVASNMAGIVEEMRGQGRRRDERLELLERHA